MKQLFAIAVLLVSTSAIASQQFYDQATVIQSSPVYTHMQQPQRCRDVPVQQSQPQSSGNNVGGAIVGGLLGAVVGNQVGSGSGKQIATVAGGVTGAVLGNKYLGGNNQPAQPQTIRECTSGDIVETIIGFDTIVQYGSTQFVTRTRNQFRDGQRVNVKVNIELNQQ